MLIFIIFSIIAILLSLRLWTFLAAKHAEKKFPPQGSFAMIRNSRIHFLRQGKGPSVVLIHGAYGSMRDFTHSIFNALAENFDVIAFDRPGFGYSQRTKETASLDAQVSLTRELLETLGVREPLIVGHSLGAAIGLGYAVRYPGKISGAVLIGGYVVPPGTPLDPVYTFPGIPVLGPFIVDTFLGPVGKWAARMVAESVFWPEPVPSGFLKMSTAMALRPATFKDNAADVRGLTAFLSPQVPRYSEIKVPVTIITGDSDLVSLPERHAEFLKKTVSGSELIVFPNTGHQPCFTQPAKIVSIIQNAWRKIEASR